MIRFSTRGEYGIRLMMDLARHYGQGPQPLSEVARHEALPATYLEQLVSRLRKAGLVVSHQGAHGGYVLSRPPIDITVGEVMRVLEGPVSPMICATEGDTEAMCERQVYCGANVVWEKVRDSVAQVLDSLTLADLVPPHAPLPPAETEETIWLRPATGTHTTPGRNATQA